MLELRLLGGRKSEIREAAEPQPEGAEVVVRVRAAAICGSDLHALYRPEGEREFRPGHEGAGEVVAVDRPRRLKLGDRVCLTPFHGCGRCAMCRGGMTAYCPAARRVYGFSADGVHAEYARIAEDCLLPIPEEIDFGAACLLLDPVGTPYHALKRIGANATHTVAVFGLGPMGLGAVMVATAFGCRVIGLDPIGYRRELAGRLGAAEVIDPAAEDVRGRVRELTGGRGVDRALECAGRAESLMLALDLVCPLGHVAIIGENAEATIKPSEHFNRKEITLSGSCCFPLGEFDEICRLAGRLRPERLITHRFAVADGVEAYRLFDAGETGKVVLMG